MARGTPASRATCSWVRPRASRRVRRPCHGGASRCDLVAHQADGARRWPNENQAGINNGIGEIGILRQETVAGMHRVGAAACGRCNDRGDIEIRLGGVRRPDLDRLIGERNGKAILVGGAVGLHRTQTKLARGPDDTDRDLSPIGDEQGLDLHNDASPLQISLRSR